MTNLEKLEKAKELIMEVEIDLIETKGFCPYEIGFTLRKLEEAIESVSKEELK
ncbi:MAG: hypothetical protein WCK67_10750 [bacterium]